MDGWRWLGMSLFNNCVGKSLNTSLKWMNEPHEWEFSEQNSLMITAPPRADFFHNPTQESRKNSAPFLYTTTNANFILTTRVSVDIRDRNDSGCLMVMADENNWAKLCYEDFRGRPSIISVVTKDISDDCIGDYVGNTNPFLRVSRYDNCIAFHYSLDGNEWALVRYFGMSNIHSLKVGVVAQSPVGDGCVVQFDYLHLLPNTNMDVRNI
jgi:regulation of enolase protein 1 (concanavalin A-like superfamily)